MLTIRMNEMSEWHLLGCWYIVCDGFMSEGVLEVVGLALGEYIHTYDRLCLAGEAYTELDTRGIFCDSNLLC